MKKTFIGAVVGTVLGGASMASVLTYYPTTTPQVTTEHSYKVLRVIDGDTVIVEAPYLPKGLGNTLYLRIHGVDTPEKPPHAKCQLEKNKAALAKKYVETSLDKAKEVLIWYNGFDKYGRILGDLLIDGEYLSNHLITQGLAVRYNGKGSKTDWCK